MRFKAVALTALVLGVLPASVLALGLGEIQLKSSLNAPLDAEIELLSATPEELASLKAQLATRDTFARYGLEYPAYLSGVTLTTVRGTDGRNVIRLRSSAAITEPFATVLVEVSWPRGRLVREYTVLLDPPTFAPAAAAAPAPIAAPLAGEGARSGAIARPAPAAAAPAPALAPAMAPAATSSAPAPAVSSTGSSYEVQRGDTLSKIVARLVGANPPAQRQAMIATYQGNPRAFDGNINLLKSGAVLRLPDQSAIEAISAAEATLEVRRQSAAWQSARSSDTAAASAPAQDPRLRLVPPQETGAPSPATTPAVAAESQAIRQRVSDLEAQLAESRRLLELRNAELAQMQARGSAAAPAVVAPVPAPAAPTPAPAPVVTPPPAPEATAPAPAAVPAPEPAPPAVATTPPPPESSSILDLLKAYWYVLAGLLALILALLGLRAARARRESSFDSSLRGLGAEPSLRDTSSDTLPLRKPNITQEDESFVVEESGTHERPSFDGARTTRKVEIEEPRHTETTPNIDSTMGLEQGDPLAEADFHMAYGLYDQAADLVRIAIQREPQRRDLKLKLLEVFFVWGNKEQFLQSARELAGTRDQAQPGEWEKIIIMGKQLAPEDALFSGGAAVGGSGMAGVDLNLEGGQNRIDFDLLGEPSVGLSNDVGVDLDIGSAFGDMSGGNDATVLDKDNLDFPLDDPGRGGDGGGNTATTRQMTQKIRDSNDAAFAPTILQPGPDTEGPTVEQPALRGGETVRQKVDTALKYGSVDQTAELALDDLGLDLGSLEITGEPLLEPTGEHELPRHELNLDDSGDAPTLVAGMDDTSRRLIADAQANAETRMMSPDGGTSESGTWLFNEKDFLDPGAETGKPDTAATQAMPMLGDPAEDASPTSKLRALEAGTDVDMDFDTLSASGKYVAPPDSSGVLDLDVGLSEVPESNFSNTQRLNADELALPDLEPATMSEVGTKLDLARAYMDMGDPEGARSILQEVLDEGSPTQKQEAQRLIDSIPG